MGEKKKEKKKKKKGGGGGRGKEPYHHKCMLLFISKILCNTVNKKNQISMRKISNLPSCNCYILYNLVSFLLRLATDGTLWPKMDKE